MPLPGNKNPLPLSPVIETIPTLVNKTGLWRFLTPVRKVRLSPCRALCPLESGIPLWMEKVKKGNWEQAWQVMEQFNPFPALTGYACYQFCRSECSRGKLDEPLNIREIEKAVGLWRHENYQPRRAERRLARGKNHPPRVAVIGSGPAGLSGAYYLNRMGAEVTVLEKEPAAGGLLATGIPGYRLPRTVLEKELAILQSEGIVIKTGVQAGKDFLLNDLAENCEALLLAVGAGKVNSLHVTGDNLPGVMGAIEFLKEINLGRCANVSGAVLVVGGGNAAVDAATAAALSGAGEVVLAYRRTEEAMPAHPEEVKAARDAGVKFLFNAVLDEIQGSRRVEKAFLSMVEPSQRGDEIRRIPGSGFTIECQTIISAAGQQSCLPGLVSLPEIAAGKDAAFLENGCCLFAAGDAVTGPSNIASAIFSGRRAALKLAEILWEPTDLELSFLPAPVLKKGKDLVSFDSLNPSLYPRQTALMHPQEEAARCFSCGNCHNCGVCWAFCPDLAIEYRNGKYEFQLDYCKGCGICVAECPAGVLLMEEVQSPGTRINER